MQTVWAVVEVDLAVVGVAVASVVDAVAVEVVVGAAVTDAKASVAASKVIKDGGTLPKPWSPRRMLLQRR